MHNQNGRNAQSGSAYSFKSGSIKIAEIQPGRIKKYWPVLITCIEDIPQFEILTDYYHQILKKNGILQEADIGPLTILNLKEFEYIMELIEQGHSFVDLLIDKTSISENIEMSFWNYLTINKEKYEFSIRPKHLNETLEVLIKDIRAELGFTN